MTATDWQFWAKWKSRAADLQYQQPFGDHAKDTPFMFIGNCDTTIPVCEIAFAKAGADGGVPGSPIPLGGSADATM